VDSLQSPTLNTTCDRRRADPGCEQLPARDTGVLLRGNRADPLVHWRIDSDTFSPTTDQIH
jgi:hypothetical protein